MDGCGQRTGGIGDAIRGLGGDVEGLVEVSGFCVCGCERGQVAWFGVFGGFAELPGEPERFGPIANRVVGAGGEQPGQCVESFGGRADYGEGPSESLDGSGIVSGAAVGKGEVLVGELGVWIEPHSDAVVSDRVGYFSVLVEHGSEIDVCLDVVGVVFDGLLEMVDGLVEAMEFHVGVADVVVGFCVIGLAL